MSAYTNDLRKEYDEEMTLAKFSLIAAQLLAEEVSEELSLEDLKDLRTRHRKHIRAFNMHLRRATKLRKKAERYERKAAKYDNK